MSVHLERRVVCAAIRNIHTLQIICSPQHFDLICHAQIKCRSQADRDSWINSEQGFVNTHGEFLTRQEAWKVAEYNNQIIKRVGGDDSCGGTLYSENLY